MSFELSHRGLHAEFASKLPFNQAVAVRIHVDSGLDSPDYTFDVQHNTHLWLVFAAAALLENQGIGGKQIYQLVKPGQGEIGDAFHDALCHALWDADKQAPYNDPIVMMPTWKSHFYDPDTGTNWMGETEPTALSEGMRFYRKSLRAYERGNQQKAGFYFGLALHYLGDLTQPMHAANFTWLDSRPFGYHTDFERYVGAVRHRVTPPARYTPRLPDDEPESYFHAVARHNKDVYFALICRSEWTQNYTGAAHSTRVWEERVGWLVAPILTDAILLTAQFMLMWVEQLSNP